MQKTQKIVVLTGIILIFLMGIFPPWLYVDESKVGHPMGYAPIWKPPVDRQRDTAELLGFKLQMDIQTQKANTIDLARLLIQIAILSVVTTGVVVLLKKASV